MILRPVDLYNPSNLTARRADPASPAGSSTARRDHEQARRAPGITGEARAQHALAGGIDDQEDLLARAQRAAEHDEALRRQRVHEDGVLAPEHLRSHGHGRVPGGASSAAHGEIAHGGDASARL
jgi:hypothetical protein